MDKKCEIIPKHKTLVKYEEKINFKAPIDENRILKYCLQLALIIQQIERDSFINKDEKHKKI